MFHVEHATTKVLWNHQTYLKPVLAPMLVSEIHKACI